MVTRVSRVSVLQCGKISGVLYAAIGMIYPVIYLPIAVFGDGSTTTAVIFVMMPFFMAAMGFFGGVFCAWIYNLVAKRIGGLEFTLDEVPE